MPHARAATKKPSLPVGKEVRIRMGTGDVKATVVEDRGAIGVGGRHLVRVRVEIGEEQQEFELPADEVTATA